MRWAISSACGDVILPPSLVLVNFHFSYRLGGDGGEMKSSKDDASFNLFNFSSIIFFSNKSYPFPPSPRQPVGGDIPVLNVLCFLPLLLHNKYKTLLSSYII